MMGTTEWQPCIFGTTNAERARLRYQAKVGRLVCPYRALYADPAYWERLTPPERMRHLAQALSRKHPSWVFAGLTAAAVLGLDYTWALLGDDDVTIVSRSTPAKGHARLRRVFVAGSDVHMATFRAGGDVVTVRTTMPARTLVDCALRYPFRLVLGMFDSAFRNGLADEEAVLAVCDGVRADCGPVFRLLHYADARSENGGESLCRATIVEHGFAVPELQRVFVDPADRSNACRVDFVWHARDGRVIVLEYDGARKYVDPSMTNRRGIQQVVRAEREREELLRRAGVAEVIRTTYDEVASVGALLAKLDRAGVPEVARIPLHERVG